MAVAAGLTVLAAVSLPVGSTPALLIKAGRWVPPAFLALGFVAAAALAWRSSLAALLAACGGVALAGLLPCIKAILLGQQPGPSVLFETGQIGGPWIAGAAGAVAFFLALWAGTRLFHVILAVAFGYLALQAVRNVNIFGLMAGFVLASQLGEWAAKVRTANTGQSRQRAEPWGLATRVVTAALIMLGTLGAATGRLPAPLAWPFTLGFRETPSIYAHDAARFAGRPGMPMRCLALGLDQAAVFLYHNAPERKPFMDPRLEVASRSTFETYLWLDKALNDSRPGWSEPVERMGGPSILLDHNKRFWAEATLLADPRWRCVYFDAVASVFLPSRRKDLETPYPTIDFAARFFLARTGDRAASEVYDPAGESLGLVCLGYALATNGAMPWMQRLPIFLLAGPAPRSPGHRAGRRPGVARPRQRPPESSGKRAVPPDRPRPGLGPGR